MKHIVYVTAAVMGILTFEVCSAPDCLRSAEAVHEKYGAWADWSRNVRGHRGEKCWFPVGKRRIPIFAQSHVAQPGERRALNSEVGGSNPSMATKEWYDEETWDALTANGSPQQRVDAAFHYLDVK